MGEVGKPQLPGTTEALKENRIDESNEEGALGRTVVKANDVVNGVSENISFDMRSIFTGMGRVFSGKPGTIA